jgi:hypothetical protein
MKSQYFGCHGSFLCTILQSKLLLLTTKLIKSLDKHLVLLYNINIRFDNIGIFLLGIVIFLYFVNNKTNSL